MINLIFLHVQVKLEAKLGLAMSINGIKNENHTFVQGLAGGSQHGNLVSRNGTFSYTNMSKEEDIYDFENSCKYH